MICTFIANAAVPLLVLLSYCSISASFAEEDTRRTQVTKESNIFGGGATTVNPATTPHIGCAEFLKTNHEAQNLEPVNFNAIVNGDEQQVHQQVVDGDEFMVASSLQQTRISCTNGVANTGSISYPCSNIDLMSFLPLSTFSVPNVAPFPNGNDIWGWTYGGREFALMGLTSGTAFVEITDPLSPIYIGILLSKTVCSSWRDMKTYANYAFIVSEAASSGMQVFDLIQLLNVDASNMPVQFVETAHYAGFSKAHNIAINEGTGFAYAVGTNTFNGGLHIVDIRNPSIPVFAGGFGPDGYTHDCQCVVYSGPDTRYTGSEICFNYNEDTVTIVDVTNKSNPVQLGRIGYSQSAYTHQGWLTDDGRHVIVDDELDETGTVKTRTHVFNVANLTNPFYVGYHSGTTFAKDHNLYIKGNLVFEANYQAGLQVLRIDNIDTASMTQVAYFDIYPASNTQNYNGAWSNYPHFPSGSVIVSGIEQGLFVLQSPNNFGAGTVRTRMLTNNVQEESTADEIRRSLQAQACTAVEDFELASAGGTGGWSVSGSCTAGSFVVGTPSLMITNCLQTQPGGDHTTGSGKALYSAPNTGVDTNDIDGGECVATSPVYSTVEESNLSAWYFHGQRDTGDDAYGDYFHLEVAISGGAWTPVVSICDVANRAAWTEARYPAIPAGSTVQLRIRASDGIVSGDAAGDLIEAGIDDIKICPLSVAFPPLSPTPTGPINTCATLNPTSRPTTRKPTSQPTTTSKPTSSPTTSAPTASPTSGVPSSAPTTRSPTTGTPTASPTSGVPSKALTPSPSKIPTASPTCIATGEACPSGASSCCSNLCPTSGSPTVKNKCAAPAPASPTRQPTVFGATGAPTRACIPTGGTCGPSASGCCTSCKGNNKCA